MEKIVYNVKEMAEILGVKPLTIYRSVNKGKIPAVKIGKNILFPKDVILEWLNTKAWEGYKGKCEFLEVINPLKDERKTKDEAENSY